MLFGTNINNRKRQIGKKLTLWQWKDEATQSNVTFLFGGFVLIVEVFISVFYLFTFWLCFVFPSLMIKSSALHKLGKHSTTKLHPCGLLFGFKCHWLHQDSHIFILPHMHNLVLPLYIHWLASIYQNSAMPVRTEASAKINQQVVWEGDRPLKTPQLSNASWPNPWANSTKTLRNQLEPLSSYMLSGKRKWLQDTCSQPLPGSTASHQWRRSPFLAVGQRRVLCCWKTLQERGEKRQTDNLLPSHLASDLRGEPLWCFSLLSQSCHSLVFEQ